MMPTWTELHETFDWMAAVLLLAGTVWVLWPWLDEILFRIELWNDKRRARR